MAMEQANPQTEMLQPQPASAKAIAKEVLKGVPAAIPHGEAISSLEHLAQLRGTIFAATEGIPLAGAAWTTANMAVYMPIVVRHSITIKQLRVVNSSAISGNFDLGLYDVDEEGLPRTRLVSTGSTAQAGASDVQSVNVSVTALVAGVHYLASVFDNGTGGVLSIAPVPVATTMSGDLIHTLDGVFEEASAFILPTTATPVALTAQRQAPLMYAGRHQF